MWKSAKNEIRIFFKILLNILEDLLFHYNGHIWTKTHPFFLLFVSVSKIFHQVQCIFKLLCCKIFSGFWPKLAIGAPFSYPLSRVDVFSKCKCTLKPLKTTSTRNCDTAGDMKTVRYFLWWQTRFRAYRYCNVKSFYSMWI